MSDRESLEFDAALEAKSDWEHSQYQADLQENAEAALLELLPDVDPEVLLTALRNQDKYGDSFNAVLIGLIDAIQGKLTEENDQREDALRKANEINRRKVIRRWSPRIKMAVDKKRRNPKLSASMIAQLVIEDEIKNKKITDERKVDYLMDTVTETLRKKLGKNAEFKAIK